LGIPPLRFCEMGAQIFMRERESLDAATTAPHRLRD
jgi:hypothetical protein